MKVQVLRTNTGVRMWPKKTEVVITDEGTGVVVGSHAKVGRREASRDELIGMKELAAMDAISTLKDQIREVLS